MDAETYVAPPHLLFVRIQTGKLKVGDIIKTRWGLREILQVKRDEHGPSVYIEVRDAQVSTNMPTYDVLMS